MLFTGLLALSSLHCGRGTGMYAPGKAAKPSSSSAASSPSGTKFDFNAEMKKESSGLRSFLLTAPDGSFTATVLASSAPKVAASEAEGAFSVSFEIGSRRPMDCAVFESRIDPATTAWKLGFDPLARMVTKEVLGIDFGADDDRPVMTFNMAALDEAKQAYVMKVIVVVLVEGAVVCRHDEIGYGATAKASTLELARTLARKEPVRAPRVHDLVILKVAGTTIGWNERQVFDGEDGASFEMESGSTLAAKGADVLADDEVTVTESDRAGFVKKVTKGQGTPKGLAKRLVLERRGETEYDVEGEVEGNKVRTKLKSKKPLRGVTFLTQEIVTNARAAKATPFVQEGWSARTPPGEILSATYTRATPFDPKAPTYLVKSDGDDLKITFDAQGLLTRLQGKIEDVPIDATRVFAKGSLQRKK